MISLVCGLGNPALRQEAANRAAKAFGATALLFFTLDEETGRYRPAQGFAQTLPGGASWRDFLRQASRSDRHSGEVAYPDLRTSIVACSIRSHGLVLTILGASNFDLNGLQPFLPLLGRLFGLESKLESAQARATAAAESSRQAIQLASALDAARTEVAETANQLRALNATLEQRVVEEVERRTKAEAALRQAQKLEAIGQLTGGVAHDFNNLLTVVVGGLDSIQRQTPLLPESPQLAKITRALNMAQQATQRAATLTARLLAFSRRQPLDPKPLDVDRVIAGMAEMLRSTLGERNTSRGRGDGGPLEGNGRPTRAGARGTELRRECARRHASGGRLTIETGNIYLDEAMLRLFPNLYRPASTC